MSTKAFGKPQGTLEIVVLNSGVPGEKVSAQSAKVRTSALGNCLAICGEYNIAAVPPKSNNEIRNDGFDLIFFQILLVKQIKNLRI